MVRIKDEWDYPDGEPSKSFKEMLIQRYHIEDKNFRNFQILLDDYALWQYQKRPVLTKNQKKSLAWIAKHKLGLAPITLISIKEGQVRYKNILTGKFVTSTGEFKPEKEKPIRKEAYYKLPSTKIIKTKRKYDVVYIDEPLKNPKTGKREYWGMNYRASKDIGINWYWGENTIIIAKAQTMDEHKRTLRHEVIEANYYKANPKTTYEKAHKATLKLERSKKTKYE